MKQVSGIEFIRLVQQRGWRLKRIIGSHRIFTKEDHANALSFQFTAISR